MPTPDEIVSWPKSKILEYFYNALGEAAKDLKEFEQKYGTLEQKYVDGMKEYNDIVTKLEQLMQKRSA